MISILCVALPTIMQFIYLNTLTAIFFFLVTHVMVILKKINYLFLSIKKKKFISEKGRIYYTICVDSRMVYKLDSGN